MELMNPEEDFTAATDKASKLRKLAEILRKQISEPGSTGQMVSGRFVPTSTQNMLLPAAQEMRAGLAGSRADAAEQAARMMQQQGMQKWASSMPQPLPGQDIQGPTEPGMPGLGQTPSIPVTRNAILKHTLAGMMNPMSAPLAKEYSTQAIKGIDAQDTRDFKSSESAAERGAKHDLKLEELANQMDIKKEQIASNERLGADTTALRRQLVEMQTAAQKYAADQRLEGTKLMAARPTGGGNANQVDNKIEDNLTKLSTRMDQLTPVKTSALNVQKIIDDNTDPTTGKVKSIPGFGYGALKPAFMQGTKEAANSAAIQAWANAVIRSQAGLSQTLNETQNQLLESLARGRGSQAQFLEIWPVLMEKLNATLDSTEAGHRPESVQRFLDRGGNLSRVYSKHDKAGAAKEAARATRRAAQTGNENPDDVLINKYLPK
jgi:hypothetical protein